MPHALSITDGTATISLSTSGVMLSRYTPTAPQWDERARQYKSVTESADLLFYDATAAAVQAKAQAVEALLRRALERAATGRGPRVYLQYQWSSDAAAWRSEVSNYRLALDDTAAQGIPQAKVSAQLIVTRAPFWEGPRTAISVGNGNGSGTGGVTVFNCNDGSGSSPNKRNNYLDIAGASVAGALPAPLELRMTNNTGSAKSYDTFYVANNAFGTTPAHIIEGEGYVAGYGSTGSDSSCSGGQYGRRTSGGAGTLVFRYAIPTAVLDAYAGRLCKVLARFRTLPGQREVRLQLYESTGLTVLGPPSPVTVTEYTLYNDGHIHDLGTVQLPPGEYTAGWAGVVLEIQFSATAAETYDIDFIQLTPTEPLTFRRIEQRGFQVANNETIVDDGGEGKIYSTTGGSVYGGLWIPLSEPVHAFPGVNQRLLFLHDTSTASDIGNKLSVQVFYRPRRLSI